MGSEIRLTRGLFRKRLIVITATVSLVTIALVSGYLLMLLQLPSEQWIGFGQIVVGFFVVLFPLSNWTSARSTRDVTAYLAEREKGSGDDEGLDAAFAALSRMPRFHFLAGMMWWCVGGALVGGAMYLRYESFGAFPAMVMLLAAGSGGFVTSIFLFFVHKRQYADFLREFAARMGDAGRRSQQVAPVPIRQKLMVAVTGVTFVTVIFAMCLAYVVSSRRLEAATTGIQSRLLDEVAGRVSPEGAAAGSGAWLADVTAMARRLGVASDVVLIDPSSARVVGGPADALFPSEIRMIVAEGDSGTSDPVDSPNAFAWRSLGPDGPRVVMLHRWSEIGGGSGAIGRLMGVMLLVAAAVSLTLSRVLADDLGNTAHEIQGEVLRMTSGDLRAGLVVESEDELGGLARSFEQMAGAVRSIVGRVAGAADRVDGTAGEIASMAQAISSGAAQQGAGVKQAATLMDGVHRQVEDVNRSAQELNLLVEESSSSILEMGAAGDELNDTAGVLLSKVDEVSSSIEEMVRSVKQIASNTQGLSDASGETSASMEEMASAMRQVDVTAEETARLSRQVIENAEQGHAKVRLTIQGMESIRAATVTAERVIRGLGDRATEIGAILDVIDDVADETNLLALNAAIIAAQAGDQGRAFSVVADEIKELADRVLASTKEIGGLIRSVQAESANAVEAITEGSRSVASGVELSMEAGASLEDITRASRESGTRIQEIVQAVREQTKAASHVVALMERVSDGVQAIQRATSEQDRGNEVVFRSAVGMREVATQLRSTTEEQSRGGARIRESIDGVRDAVEAINRAIQIQSESNAELVRFLEEVSSRSVSNEASATRLAESTRALREQSDSLHEDVRRFQT